MKRSILLGIMSLFIFCLHLSSPISVEAMSPIESECLLWEIGMDPHTENLCETITFHDSSWSSSVTDLHVFVPMPDAVLMGCDHAFESNEESLFVCGAWWSTKAINVWEWSPSLDTPPVVLGDDGNIINLPWTGIYNSKNGYLFVNVTYREHGSNTASGVLPD